MSFNLYVTPVWLQNTHAPPSQRPVDSLINSFLLGLLNAGLSRLAVPSLETTLTAAN